MAVTFSPASDFTMAELADIFNKGYEAYFTTFNFDAARMQNHIESHDIVMSASRVARQEDGTPVGVALLGKRDQRGWVGGVGIYLPERGKGIGKQLMTELIESARQENIRDLYLEVLTQNANAHALYVKLGFQQTRRVVVIHLNELETVDVSAENIQPIELDEALILRDRWQTPPNTWQYAPETLRKTPNISCLTYGTHDQPEALIIFRAFPGETEFVHLFDVAMEPDNDEALKRLISHLRQSKRGANIRMVNLPEDNAEWQILASMGAQEMMSQYEMLLQT
jgi:RimJ/RimL family protein N-acetyltransferase